MKISAKLSIFLILAAFIPLMVVSLVSLKLGQSALKNNIGQGYKMLAKEKAIAIERLFEDRINEVKELTYFPQIIAAVKQANASYQGKQPLDVILPLDEEWIKNKGRTKTADAIQRNSPTKFLKQYQKLDLERYGEIFITDRYGANVAMTNITSDYYQADEGWWQGAFNAGEGGVYLDDRGYDDSVGTLVVGIVLPIKDREEVIGIFKINYKVQSILDIVSQTDTGKSSRVYLVRLHNGEVVVGSGAKNLEQLGKERLSFYKMDDWMESVYANSATILAYAKVSTKLNQRELVAGEARGIYDSHWQSTQWLVIIELDQDEAFKPIDQMAQLFVYIGVTALLSIILMVWYLARSITVPLRNLAQGTEIIGAGDLEHRLATDAKDEIGDLSRAFDAMTKRLQSSTATLSSLQEEVEARRLAEVRETRLGRILDNSSNEIYIFDPDTLKILEVNAGVIQNIGFSKDELKTMTPLSIKPEISEEEFNRMIEPLLDGKQDSLVFDTVHLRKDGSTYPVSIRLELFTNETPPVFVAIVQDITDRKAAETQLLKASEKLLESNKELQNFAYLVSHDLQEPLRMVSSYVALLERRYQDKLDQDAHEFIRFAVDGANRMSALIDGLLQYSRVQTMGAEFDRVDMEDVLQDVLQNLYLVISDSGARINHDPLPIISADKLQIERVLQNLISNSIKFCKDKTPVIDINVKREEEGWLFSVKDNGIGIDQKDNERIFILFQRLHTRDEFPGSGIGLAVCKRIIERHGGRIWLEPDVGKMGAKFCFTLPFVEENS